MIAEKTQRSNLVHGGRGHCSHRGMQEAESKTGTGPKNTLLQSLPVSQFLEVPLAGDQELKMRTCGVISDSNHSMQIWKIRKRT